MTQLRSAGGTWKDGSINKLSPGHNRRTLTLWQLLGLAAEVLERVDLVEANLLVARGTPALADLDVYHYVRRVDAWTKLFSQWLPSAEEKFRRTPEKWKNDLNFFRIGMLQGFLGHHIGIRYVDEQKHVKAVAYTNPSDLFLNGVIDTLRGTCANMPTLHVAMARRMGWPVSLACAKAHCLSRYDDGRAYHNIESTSTHAGSFTSDPDEYYIERFELPRRAIECGSDLRRLTMREMLGLFVSFRGRHYSDINRDDLANIEFALSRHLFPSYRNGYLRSLLPMLRHGEELFERNEMGHPSSVLKRLAPVLLGSISDPKRSRSAGIEV